MANRIIDDEFCAEIVETDISDLCRICGSPSDSPLVPIYEGNGLVQELASKIMQHLPIKISQEDILPVKSCISCTNVILTWHLLYECCVDADRRFQTILADEQIDSVLEKDIAKIKHSEEGSKDDKVQNTSHHEMEDVMFLQAEFGPEDEQYLDDDVAGTPDEDDDKGDDKKNVDSPICNILTHICPTCNEPVDNIEENVNINLLNSRLDCKPRYGECYECITHSKTESGPRNKQKKHGKQLYKCKLCTKCFKSEKSYKAHKASDDCNTLLYMCPICNCSSDRKLNLQIHLQSHTKDNPCRICCSSFNTILMLENHKASHAKSDLTKYDDFSTQITCNDCKERFYSKFDLYFHTITNHNSEDEKFSCLLCKRVFESVTMLRHHSKVHEEKETFQCHECGKTFKKLKNFEEHKNVHLNSRPFQCSICLQTFKYSSNLSQHRAIHKEVRSFACSYCDKKFTRSNNLNMHLKTHRNERNYSCDLCSSSFVQSSSLHKHIRALHRKCDKCGVIVGDRKQWQIHLWKECKETIEFVTKV